MAEEFFDGDSGPNLDELWREYGRTDAGRVARAFVSLTRQELRTAGISIFMTSARSLAAGTAAIVFIALGVIGAVGAIDTSGVIFFTAFAVVFLALTLFLIHQNYAQVSLMPTTFELCVYRFTETSVSITSKSFRQSNSWTNYKSCHMGKDGYLLRSRRPYSFIYLPRRAFITPGDEELFFELARTHVG
jgi:hypothetical protein